MPLHNACSYGHYEVAELLVRHGASVNVADLWKFTPLHEAAAKGKYEICKLLLKVSRRRAPGLSDQSERSVTNTSGVLLLLLLRGYRIQRRTQVLFSDKLQKETSKAITVRVE